MPLESIMDRRRELQKSSNDRSRSEQGGSEGGAYERHRLPDIEKIVDMPKLVDDSSRAVSQDDSGHARAAVRGKGRAVPVRGVRRSERLKRKIAEEAGEVNCSINEAVGVAALPKRKRGRSVESRSHRKGPASEEAVDLRLPGPRPRKIRREIPASEKERDDGVRGKGSAQTSNALKSGKTAVPKLSGSKHAVKGQSKVSSLPSLSSPSANAPARQPQPELEENPLAPRLDSPDRSIRKSQNEEVHTPVQGQPSSNGVAADSGGVLPPKSNPPLSIARLAAALEGFAYQRGSVSDTSSLGVRTRTPVLPRRRENRSMSPVRGSLSGGNPVASPSVSFEGEHLPQGSANSAATGGSVRDQHGDSHAPPRKGSKRRQRASLKVIEPGEKVRQAALALIADGKQVTAEGIRALIPEESEKKGTEGWGGGGVKRPAGEVDPDWVPPVSPYGLIQEELWRTPWKLLVACLLLNVTSGGQMRRVIWDLFELIPTPEAAIAADTGAMGRIIHSLGLQNKRAATIQRFSQEYLEHLKDPAARPLAKVHGIGKYAADAHAIFCEGRWQEVLPHDHVLNRYWEWMWATRGEGAAFKRDEK